MAHAASLPDCFQHQRHGVGNEVRPLRQGGLGPGNDLRLRGPQRQDLEEDGPVREDGERVGA